ncbi:MAG: Spy/CpxP family protein refolding chaperone [Oryzomonas sp.]|uniref:Spy/CpxP family protein refolding chaperone n=1 Tax=Oryzomonas sp. TaxID=2855186 RepID=UPI00284E72E8|nr:Spy/CpxP family protein refolding chaperone [Oryzomonas sp.]MDR3579781.1 Spy/CpxP family protein refolding chaperone [Oryzomonas sp.]
MRHMARLAAVIGTIALFSTGVFAMGPEGAEHSDHHGCGCEQKHAGHDGMRHDFKKFPWILKKKLGLTGKQAGEISDIMEAEHAKAKPLFEAIHKERKALMVVSLQGSQTAIKDQSEKLANAIAALAIHRAGVHKRIAAVMTKEQADKFDKMAEEFGKHDGPACHHEQEHHEMSEHHQHGEESGK